MPYDTPSPAYGTLSYHVAVELIPRPLPRSGRLLRKRLPFSSNPNCRALTTALAGGRVTRLYWERFGLGRVLAHA